MIALTAQHRATFRPSMTPDATGPTIVASQLAALALDYVEIGVFVLDADSQLQFANASAKRLFAANRLSVRNARLYSPDDLEVTVLRRLVKQCISDCAAGSAQMTYHRLGDGADALCLALVAVDPAACAQPAKPLVMLFVNAAGASPLPDSTQLRHQFGLTDAQARLAIEIAKGDGLRACARRLGIAVTTGRSHLKQIFCKTETRRQAELVRLIASFRLGAAGTKFSR